MQLYALTQKQKELQAQGKQTAINTTVATRLANSWCTRATSRRHRLYGVRERGRQCVTHPRELKANQTQTHRRGRISRDARSPHQPRNAASRSSGTASPEHPTLSHARRREKKSESPPHLPATSRPRRGRSAPRPFHRRRYHRAVTSSPLLRSKPQLFFLSFFAPKTQQRFKAPCVRVGGSHLVA